MKPDSNGADRQLPRLAPRPSHAHKGDFGHVLVVGGARGMAGAVGLCGRAALRSGAGLVTIATASCCLETVSGWDPCYMTVPLSVDPQGCISQAAIPELIPYLEKATVIACGPGLGRSSQTAELVRWLYSTSPLPMVVDADGLFALSSEQMTSKSDRTQVSSPSAPRIVTPHLGEFRRLSGHPEWNMEVARREGSAWAARHQVTLVLKGHATLVTDGDRVAENQTGNPGMSTGGSGDVLTGVIAGLLAQHLPPWDAARLGTHLHGLAGDLAVEDVGQVSLIATDLLAYLPQAFQQHSSYRSETAVTS